MLLSDLSSCKESHETVLALAAGSILPRLYQTAYVVASVVISSFTSLYPSWLRQHWCTCVQMRSVPYFNTLWHSLEHGLINHQSSCVLAAGATLKPSQTTSVWPAQCSAGPHCAWWASQRRKLVTNMATSMSTHPHSSDLLPLLFFMLGWPVWLARPACHPRQSAATT